MSNGRKSPVEILNPLLQTEGFSLKAGFGEDVYVIDEEGEQAFTLTSDFVAAITETAEAATPATSPNIAVIFRELYFARRSANQQQFEAGKRFGRAELIKTAHELLGIGRLVDAIEKVADRLPPT
jgi:hypothetical protein